MEMVAEAKILVVYQVCDKCGEGIMEYDKNSAQSNDWIAHRCVKCGHVERFPFEYPYQRIVPIEVLREPVGREITG